jgi:hypothetical protein
MSSAFRHRCRSREPVDRTVDALTAGEVSDAVNAGTRPAVSDDRTAQPAANSATRQSSVTTPSVCVVAGAIDRSTGSSQPPMPIASATPTALTMAISSKTSRATDHRVAPMARRSASSPLRDVTCASVRLAMLQDAMSSSTITPPNRIVSGARKLPNCQDR